MFFLSVDKHSPWETSFVPLYNEITLFFFASALKTVPLEVIEVFFVFCPNWLIFLLRRDWEWNSGQSEIVRKKLKNRKQQLFCFGSFLNFKLVQIDLELNLHYKIKLILIKNVGVILRKAAKLKTWKSGLKSKKKKNFFWSIGSRYESGGTKIFKYSRPQDS